MIKMTRKLAEEEGVFVSKEEYEKIMWQISSCEEADEILGCDICPVCNAESDEHGNIKHRPKAEYTN
jgi:hypothetical protein